MSDKTFANAEILPETVEIFKQTNSLMELARRRVLNNDHRRYASILSQQQFTHLMMVRNALPCNLGTIMLLTGLTSAGASLFVDKMVQKHIMERVDNPEDRRNVIISFTPRALKSIRFLENKLNCFLIHNFAANCSHDEMNTIINSMSILLRILKTLKITR